MGFMDKFGSGEGWFSKIGQGGEGFMGKFGTGKGAFSNMFPKRKGNNTTTNQFDVDQSQYEGELDPSQFPGIDFGIDEEGEEIGPKNEGPDSLIEAAANGSEFDVKNVVRDIEEGNKGEAIDKAQDIIDDDDDEEEDDEGGFLSGLGKGFSSAGSSMMQQGRHQYGNIFGDR
jgi:hypothetical protein